MKAIQINPADNVAVAIQPLSAGEGINIGKRLITIIDDIPAGHKFLLENTDSGMNIIKYGYPIGTLSLSLKQGNLINETNLRTNLKGLLSYDYHPVSEVDTINPTASCLVSEIPKTFSAYKRKNGEVGIRNDIWIIPTVGCVNGICQQLANTFNSSLSHVCKAIAFCHNYGCSQLSEDHENTRKILRDIALHPNAGAILIVGLGCENNQPEKFMNFLGEYNHERIRMMVCQEVKGNEIDNGMEILSELSSIVEKDARVEVPLSELRIGLKCGGSDGFSGITANPLLGVVSDLVVMNGGTSVLTEVPEMFGAETILMNRCANKQLFDKTVTLINNFKEYFLSYGEPVGENPSPGNKAGGISTLEEKALGCTQKCGKSIVSGVLNYGDRLSDNGARGLNLLSAPGNDLVASTALAASGCHIVLFTTGRGTPFGTFVPTMKISTNSALYQNKSHWIDFNAGVLLEGIDMEGLAKSLINDIIAIASGKQTLNERNNYSEISIFKNGVTL